MKIGILTQSMAANYGCNIQAYALQTILERMGHDVEILDRWFPPIKKTSRVLIFQQINQLMKDCVKFCLCRPIYHIIQDSDKPFFWRNIISFQQQYLHLSKPLYTAQDMIDYTSQHHFDAFIVGSDQVWRPAYNLGDKLYDMYLDFAQDKMVKRISYAASFGVDNWEYTNEQTQICAELIQQFNAVSVREKSGVDLCKQYYNVDAKHVLDPTLLLRSDDYNTLIDSKLTGNGPTGLFCYVLDPSSDMMQTIDYIEKQTGLKRYTCLPLVPENTYNVFHREGSILSSPEEWLRCFRNAEMILVDSFHGMVFSIIYNKPFWVVGNPKRGMARFNSLLSLFGLEERLVNLEQLRNLNLKKTIDWSSVNQKRLTLVADSKLFLKKALM